jgi:hypothetical protein
MLPGRHQSWRLWNIISSWKVRSSDLLCLPVMRTIVDAMVENQDVQMLPLANLVAEVWATAGGISILIDIQ